MEDSMKVIEYAVKSRRNGRRGTLGIPEGTRVFLVKHEPTATYWSWAYLDEQAAERMVEKLTGKWSSDAEALQRDLEFNFVRDPERSVHTFIPASQIRV